MMLTKAAGNMTSIWHYVHSFPTNFQTSRYTNYLHNNDSDTCNKINPGLPDFSEFKETWENYSNSTTISMPYDTKHLSNENQYYCDTCTKDSEKKQIKTHNQCKTGMIESKSLNQFHEDNDSRQSPIFSQSHQKPLILNQETCKNLVLKSQSTGDQQFSISNNESNVLSRNISPISAFCDFFEEFCGQTKKPNSCDFSTSSFRHSLYDDKNNHPDSNHNQSSKQTDYPDSSIDPSPCINPNNVATQPHLSAASYVENVNGGLAGALSRLTMGEVRTEEQRAIEDHIRKQNWEQGQIDFMGQDSFDNILQKINETLASVPPRQQSPVKETRQPKKSSRKSSEVETAVEESDATLPGTLKLKQPRTSQKSTKEKKNSK